MATQTVSRVDVGALAASLVGEAQLRISGALAAYLQTLDEKDGQALNEFQMKHLLVYLLSAFDGLERSVAALLVDDLKGAIEIWGLPRELADLATEGAGSDA